MITDVITVDPKQFGLEESKAADIAAQFKPMLDKMVELEKEYNEVVALPIETAGSKAKNLRLKYVKVRTGTAEIHKTQKAFYLAAGRYVDGWKNTQLFASEGIEKKLQDIENHTENLEKERIAALQIEREAQLEIYGVENLPSLRLGEMTQSVFDNFLLGTKTAHENKIAAEKLAEEQRLAAIEAENKRLEDQRLENERLKKEADEQAAILEAERQAAAAAAKEAADRLEAELNEAARLAKIESDKQAAKLAEIEAVNKAARDKAAKQLADEQAAAKKLADALQAIKDAEAKTEAERKAAEKKAAKAPVKEKLKVAIDGLTLDLPESDITANVLEKFAGFKNWALQEIEKI